MEVLIFTIFDEEDKVLEAVKAGASGYLLKGAPAEKIVEAIQEVKAGGTVIQPSLARRLLQHFRVPESRRRRRRRPAPRGRREPLTEREIEILRLIAQGHLELRGGASARPVAATIRTHLEHIYQKLEVTNRVEAVTEGLRKGLIEV